MSPQVGKYELVSLLGRGGGGEVWRARDEELGRTVALKLLHGTSPEDLARFRREAHAAARLNHPHVAQVFEFAEDPPRLAMQFVDGVPIDQVPKLETRLDALRDAARAVQHAHEHGLLHRDLKPANLLVDAAGCAFVLDFGLAREVKGSSEFSRTGDILGTPSYMAPEQARGDVRAQDARTDVYGLGATLYAILAGRPPHTGPTAYEVVARVVEEDPSPPGGDRDLETICLKAIDKDPARRYPSAAAFADDLDRWRQGETILARPASAARRLRKRIARRPAVWGLSALLLAAVVAGAGFGAGQILRRVAAEREAAGRQRVLALLERAARRQRELETDLARRVEAARLGAIYGELDRMVRDLADDAGRHPEEAAAFFFYRGEANTLRNRDDEAAADYGRAIAAAESDWSRAMSVRALASLGRARASFGRLEQVMLVSLSSQEERHLRRAQDLVPSILADLGAASAGRLPEEELRIARLWDLYARRRFDEVVAGATEEIDRGGRGERFYHVRGVARSALGDVEGAQADLTESLDRYQGRAWVWFDRGLVAENRGDLPAATADYTRAIELNPRFADAFMNRGVSHAAAGNVEASLSDLNRAAELNPTDPDIFTNRAATRRMAGDVEGALADYAEAERIDPREVGVPFGRGLVFLETGRVDEARAEFDRAISMDARFAPAWTRRGIVRRMQGDLPGAIEDHTRALTLSPGFPDAWHNRGAARFAAGDLAGAEEDFTRALSLLDDPETRGARGGVRLQRLDYRGAAEDFAIAAAGAPKAAYFDFLAIARAETGDETGAREAFQRGLERSPDDAGLLYDFARFLLLREDLAPALPLLERFLDVAPDHPRADAVRRDVERIRAVLGNPDD